MTDRDKALPGAGIAAMSLATSLLAALHKKGLLSDRDAHDLLDMALLGLEELGPLNEETAAARARLEELLQGLRSLPPARSD